MADKFFWYELMTTDRDAAIDYYEAVVGWNATEQAGARPDIGYTILSAGDRAMGGVIELSQEMCDGGARPGWVGYIHVADADAKAREIVEAGGKVLMGPDDIPDIGRFALLADPGGAPFYIITPFRRDDDFPNDPTRS